MPGPALAGGFLLCRGPAALLVGLPLWRFWRLLWALRGSLRGALGFRHTPAVFGFRATRLHRRGRSRWTGRGVRRGGRQRSRMCAGSAFGAGRGGQS
jgi:hypothetical protein